MYSIFLDFVLKTKDVPGLKQLYWLAYRMAVSGMKQVSKSASFVSELIVYRGWCMGNWQAGISDLDFQLIIKQSPDSSEDSAEIGRFWKTYHSLRRLFPMLGELLIATRSELESYVMDGGGRAQEFVSYSRPLLNKRTVLEALPHPNPAADLAEALHAYTRLMILRFGGRWEHPVRVGNNARKALVDLMRFSDSALSNSFPALRKEYEPGFFKRDPACAAALARTDLDFICSHAFRYLENACSGYFKREGPASGDSDGDGMQWMHPDTKTQVREPRWEETVIKTFDSFFKEHLQCNDGGVLMEDGYRVQWILNPTIEDRLLSRVWPGIEELRKENSFLATLPMILPRSAWKFMTRSSYLHHPTAFLDATLGDGSRLTGGGKLSGFKQLRYHLPDVNPPPYPEAVRNASLQSLRHLNISWRTIFFEDAWPNAVHHLYTRALGLRLLLEKGIGISFSDMDFVLKTARVHLPDTVAWIDSMDLGDQTAKHGHFTFLDGQFSRMRKLDGISGSNAPIPGRARQSIP